jgi:UPF0755 protein
VKRRFVALVVVLAVLAFGSLYLVFAVLPASTPELRRQAETKRIFVPRRTSLKKLATILEDAGLVRFPELFYFGAMAKHLSHGLQAGEFDVPTRSTLNDLYRELRFGKPVSYKVVIPEGSNMYQVADLLRQRGLVESTSEFIGYLTDSSTLAKYALDGTKAVSLEGYLFPDTYEFTKLDDTARIADALVTNFQRHFLPEWEDRARELGLTAHEVVVFASMVEKETGLASERPIIASVFHNRLKREMRLESDPTTIYGIKNFNGNLRRADLQQYTPYNTYRLKGLPLGPISNPGTDAIKAVLFPAQTKYLFFVARNDGSHHFSESYKEHNRAVTYYQKMGMRGNLPKKTPSTPASMN